ncbi:MAG: hypothetical protein AAFX46_15730 [Cyanobacteria bacterium J06636_27]
MMKPLVTWQGILLPLTTVVALLLARLNNPDAQRKAQGYLQKCPCLRLE